MKETMLYPIRQVKKELRALGIAVKKVSGEDAFNIIGVVFRGNSLLDGVMKTVARGSDLTSDIAQMILSSPHYKQIRIIMLDHPIANGLAFLDASRLSSSVSKPVLILSLSLSPPFLGEGIAHFNIEKMGIILNVVSVGLKSRIAERIIGTASRHDEAVPECLRIANIILDSLAGIE